MARSARATSLICAKGARIESAWEQATGLWLIALHTPRPADDGGGDCVKLMLRGDGDRWTYDGAWSCRKSIFDEEWRRAIADLGA